MATQTIDTYLDDQALGLPAGYTVRGANMADAPLSAAMLNCYSRATFGVEKFTPQDLASEWTWNAFDPQQGIRLVFDAQGNLAGHGECFLHDMKQGVAFVWGRTHPEYLGQGIGSYLLNWAEQRARQHMHLAPEGAQVALLNSLPSIYESGLQLLAEQGYRQNRRFYRMVIDLDAPPAAPVWPAGITLRPFDFERDSPAVVQALDESFSDHWGHVHRPLEEEVATMTHFWSHNPRFDPSLFFVAMHGEQVAGISLCYGDLEGEPEMAWVGQLGVRRPWRGQGLGLALLRHSFVEFYRRGSKQAGLGVDAESLTGALRLYEKAGMRSQPERGSIAHLKVLRPGRDLRTLQVE